MRRIRASVLAVIFAGVGLVGRAGVPVGVAEKLPTYVPGRLHLQDVAAGTSVTVTAGPSAKVLQGSAWVILCAGALLGVILLLKKGLPLSSRRPAENRLNLLETKMLGNRQFLVVVQYEDNRMLLGVSPGNIEYLCAVDGPCPELEEIVASRGVEGTNG